MYGASMLGELVRSTDNSLACEPFQKAVVQPAHGLPPVLLAERGGHHVKPTAMVPVMPNKLTVMMCYSRMLLY